MEFQKKSPLIEFQKKYKFENDMNEILKINKLENKLNKIIKRKNAN